MTLEEEIKALRAQLIEKEKELNAKRNTPDVMASNFKPGVTDMYQFVDYIKSRKYRVPQGTLIIIKGGIGGTVVVEISTGESNAG